MTWLRKHFQETPTDGPAANRVKFQSIHQSLAVQFPSTKFSSKVVSDIEYSAFPHITKEIGKAHTTHVYGIEVVRAESEETQPENDLAVERALNAKLTERVQQLETRAKQLEQYQTYSLHSLTLQMDTLMNPRHSGPDTVEHLEAFSVDNIIAEFRQHCPNILEIFHSLAKSSEDDPNREVKVIISLCVLIKATHIKCWVYS